MRKRYFSLVITLILAGLLPIACITKTESPTSPVSLTSTVTTTLTLTVTSTPTVILSPTATNTVTATQTPTLTATLTPTLTLTIVYPTGTFTPGPGTNPPVQFTIMNNSESSETWAEIALYPYPSTGYFYESSLGPVSSGSAGGFTIQIPNAGNYFIYYYSYIAGSYILLGWAPIYLTPGDDLAGNFYSSTGTLAGQASNSYCLGCGLP